MKWVGGLLLLAAVASSAPQPKGKAFSLFSVVTFANDACTTTSTTETTGICQTSSECSTNGGSSSGNCASGFGVCCIYKSSTCGTDTAVKNNCTYLQNPGYSSTYSTASKTCSWKITGSADICQIRLDFVKVAITGPATADGDCNGADATQDAISVTSPSGTGAAGMQEICGTLTGSHIYIETAMATTAAKVTVATGTGTAARSWNIKVKMIECDNPSRAPTDCLQYHTGAAGKITNINSLAHVIDNLNYLICIRKEAGMCSIQYTEAASSPDSFALKGSTTVAKVGTNCSGVYLLIPTDGSTESEKTLGRYCGAILATKDAETSASVVTTNKFTLGFISNANNAATITGFKLLYTQKGC